MRVGRRAPVGIENECNIVHLPIRKPLFEGHVVLLKSLASLLNVVNRYGDMTKTSTRVSVAICVTLKVRVVLRAVVVRKLKDACTCAIRW
jgi:hypothetical protein